MIADQMLADWHHRYGPPHPPKDVWMQAQIEVLRNILRRMEMILEDNGVPFTVIRQVLRELIYGAYPNPAEAEIRINYEQLARDGMLKAVSTPQYFGYTTPDAHS